MERLTYVGKLKSLEEAQRLFEHISDEDHQLLVLVVPDATPYLEGYRDGSTKKVWCNYHKFACNVYTYMLGYLDGQGDGAAKNAETTLAHLAYV